MGNMKMMIVSITIGALGTVTKGLVQGLEDLEIRGRVETIQTTALLRSGRILRRSPGDLRRLAVAQTNERPSANADAENIQGLSIIMVA